MCDEPDIVDAALAMLSGNPDADAAAFESWGRFYPVEVISGLARCRKVLFTTSSVR